MGFLIGVVVVIVSLWIAVAVLVGVGNIILALFNK